MGNDDMSTLHVAVLRGVEMTLKLIQEGWHRTPGRTTR